MNNTRFTSALAASLSATFAACKTGRFWSALTGFPQRGLVLLVRGYRFWLKPWLGQACRFEPTCSAYALQALQDHGATRGAVLSGWRLLRCHPWCDGGCDPVPAKSVLPAAATLQRMPKGASPTDARPDPLPAKAAKPISLSSNSARGLFTQLAPAEQTPPTGGRCAPVNRNQP